MIIFSFLKNKVYSVYEGVLFFQHHCRLVKEGVVYTEAFHMSSLILAYLTPPYITPENLNA